MRPVQLATARSCRHECLAAERVEASSQTAGSSGRAEDMIAASLPASSSLRSQDRGMDASLLTDHLRKLLQIDIAARDNGYNFSRSGTTGLCSCNRAGSSSFHHNAISFRYE